MVGGWRLGGVDGVHVARSAAIDAIPGVAHAFSTRVAFGRTDFDLGPAIDDDGEVRFRRAAFLRAAGFGSAPALILRQVHGGVIVRAERNLDGPPIADGAIRVASQDVQAPIPTVRTADCVAVLLVDRHGGAMAAVHAGWRGVGAAIGARAVARFADEGIAAADIVVALGPAILGCCYEVGDEVVDALTAVCGAPAEFVDRAPSGRARVDLHAALRQQLLAAGVPAGSIHAAPWCTRCRTDLFFSVRAEGAATGRLMAAIGPAYGP